MSQQIEAGYPLFTDLKGHALDLGYIWIGVAGLDPETNPTVVYWDEALTTPALQPVRTISGLPSRQGTPANLYINTAYSIKVKTRKRETVYTELNKPTPVLSELANTSDVLKGDALIGVKQSLPGSVARTQHSKNADVISVLDLGILNDGTDQTYELLDLFTANAGFRGSWHIPYGTVFNLETVYAASPVGLTLNDESSVNWGQPPSYQNKFSNIYSKDDVDDDMGFMVSSGHHPAILINNFGTSGTTSATVRRSTVVFGAGYRGGDPISGFFQQQYRDTDTGEWIMSYRLQTSGNAAVAPEWDNGVAVTTGDYALTTADRVYKATTTGTTGDTEPTHTSGTASDGGVTWLYISDFILDSTRHWWLEGGEYAQWGAKTRLLQTNITGNRSHWIGVGYEGGSYANDIAWRDVSRGTDVLRVSDSKGLQFNTLMSCNFKSLSGATPTLNGSFGYVNNGVATNMTNMLIPSPQTDAYVTLLFANGNTTLVHGATLQLKGAANVTVPGNGIMRFLKYQGHSSSWLEMSRSF